MTLNADGSPTGATVRLDDNAGGAGWFFDNTPLDDAEFSGLADSFSSSFVDVDAVANATRDDFYRTVTNEIGHALGITSNSNAAINGMLPPMVDASVQVLTEDTDIELFHNLSTMKGEEVASLE